MTDIPLRWVGTDATGAAASSVKKNIESVGKAASGAQGGVKGLSEAMDKMAPAGKSAQSALSGMESAAKGLLGGLGGVAAAMGVGALIGFGGQMVGAAVDMGKAAEASDRLRTAMDGMASQAGTSGAQIISSLKQASGGAIAEYDLMLSANKAMMLGVASSAEDMGKLMEIARTRGSAMGLSATQAFNDLVTGLGRGSALILDNLGIIVDADAANQAYAESVGKTVSQLSEQEKKQALVNVTLKEATGAAMPAASAYERMGAAFADLKVSMGDMFGPALAAGIEVLAAGARGLVEVKDVVVESFRTTTGEEIRTLIAEMNAAKKAFNDLSQMSTAATQRVVDEIRRSQAEADALGVSYTPSAQTFGLSEEDWNGVLALRDSEVIQQRINAYATQEVDIRREITSQMREAAGAAEELAVRESSSAALKTQYAGVADLQAYGRAQAEVRAKASEMGLSVEQTNAVIARMDAQFRSLTGTMGASAYSMATVSEATSLTATSALAAVTAMAGVADKAAMIGPQLATLGDTSAADAQRAAIMALDASMQEGAKSMGVLHGAQVTATGSATGLGYAFNLVRDTGFGAKSGIDAAGEAANHAQSGFYGLVTAAQAASVAMRQAQVDASSASLKSAYMGATGTLGADRAYSQYQNAQAAHDRYAKTLDALNVTTEKSGFMLAEFDARISDSINTQVQAVTATQASVSAAHAAATGLGVAKSAAGGAAGKLGTLAEKAGDLSGKLQGLLDKVPGLKGTSEVTDKQLSDAKLGIPQNFADDYLRHLTDEVLNGVDWADADIGDAARRAGIDPNLPAQTILEMFKGAWADSSLFANPANLDLINMDAVKQALMQANAAATGKANIDALFGIGDDATVAAVASLGLKVQSGLAQWLTDNGAPDAGARLAAALGAGVTTAGIPLDGGLQTWQGSDAATSVAKSVGSWLGAAISAATIIIPTVQMPTVPSAPTTPTAPATAPQVPNVPLFASGTTYFGGGWAKVHKDEVVRLAAGPVYNARQSSRFAAATVVVNAVINNKMSEAQFAQMLRNAMRRAQVRS